MDKIYKVALVTGASSGIGRAVAEKFAGEGYRLILLARRKEKLQELASNLKTKCHIIALDVREKDKLKEAFSNLPKEFSEIDILVNSAGGSLGLDSAQKALWEDWEQMIETNCTALAYITHMLLPGMVARKKGHIVNLGSVAGDYAYPGGNVYGAAKSFVEHFSRNLKSDLIGTGVRVTNSEPGMVEPEFSLVRFKGDKEKAKNVYCGMTPLFPESIADAILWSVTRPQNVNINRIEIMPECQGPGPFAVIREQGKK